MSGHIGMRFEGKIKKEHVPLFNLIHQDKFGRGIVYMPNSWKGCCKFNTKTGILKFTFSTSDYDYMDEIISLLGLYLDSCRMCEVYHEFLDYSKLYVLKDEHLTLENDNYIKYCEELI